MAVVKPFQGVVVNVACPGEPASSIVQRYGPIWASQTGARIHVVHYDPATAPADELPGDLWILSPAWMPHWANADKLWPVPPELVEPDGGYAWQNLLPLYRYKLCIWDQKVVALPLLGDARVCFYRDDLFQDAGHREAFHKKYGRELGPPATWQQFTEIAEYFHKRKRPGIDHPCPSLPPLPNSSDEFDSIYYSVAVPFARRAVREDDPKPPPAVERFSFHYDLDSGAVRIDTPGFVHALELLQRQQRFRPAEAVPEPPIAFQNGEAVLCVASPAWIRRFQESPLVRDKFGLCPVPGSSLIFDYQSGKERPVGGINWVPYLGADGWLIVVPRHNATPEAAFALAASLSGPKTSQDVVIEPTWGGGVYRREHLEGGIGWHQLGLDRKRTTQLVDILRQEMLHRGIMNPVLRLRTPDEREHQRALDAEVRAALLDGKDAGQALKAAADRWRQMDERKDLKTRLAEYRLSLSLNR
ncbi:MAG TPA: extracellular solute-binding protein [Gemmataceae bacterium]|nr:extracellular solute-binding protein [Gemmataceae bacterium]